MAVVTPANASAVFDLKSAALTLVAVVLRTRDLDALAAAMALRFGATPDLFDREPVAIDLTPLREEGGEIDFAALVALLVRYKMLPVAVRGGSASQHEAAARAGLVEAAEVSLPRVQPAAAPAAAAQAPAPAPAAAPAVPAQAAAQVAVPAPVVQVLPASTTLVIDKPLRSGQQVYARGGDLVVMAVVSFGAEVIADGNIHIYAPLRGRALAGARGDTTARIFSTCMEPQLVAVAGIYRTTETALPPDVQGKPAQVRLVGESIVVEPLRT